MKICGERFIICFNGSMRHADGFLQLRSFLGNFCVLSLSFASELLTEDILEQADCKWVIASIRA